MNFKYKFLVIILLFFATIACAVKAQQLSIKGLIPGCFNENVTVAITQDYLTNTENVLAQTQTDSTGKFNLIVPVKAINLIIIKTNDRRASFFAEPDSSYFLQLGIPDSNAIVTLGLAPEVSLKILNKPKTELNQKVNYFENLLDSFYSNNNIYFTQPRILHKQYDEFKKRLISDILINVTSYFTNYVNYSLAPIEEAIYQNKIYSFNHYFNDMVLYHHVAYMRYFNSFFNHYFKVMANGKYGETILTSINDMHSYDKAMENILKSDTLLKNDTLRELVLMKGLQETYYEKGMNKQSIEMILSYILLKGKGAENKMIAKNLLDNLNALEIGKLAPVIDLNYLKYKTTNDLKGNLIYIIFWATWNAESLQELKLLQKINTKYGHRVSFIAINIDEQNEVEKKYLTKNKFDFYTVTDASKYLVSQYHVKSVPYAILIDEDGDIFKTMATLPSNNLEILIRQLIKRKK